MAFDFTKHAGAGVSDISDDVLGMPLLNIVQSGSPQVKPSHKDYAAKKIPGCLPGDLVFAPTNSVVARPVKAVVLATTTIYTEWRPKTAGGGFIGYRPLSVVNERGYRTGPKGTKDEYKEFLGDNELNYTMFFAIQFLDGAKWRKGYISLKSSGLKAGRDWVKGLKRMRLPGLPDVEPPIFAGLWNINTKAEQKNGEDWMGWDISFDRMLDGTADEALLSEAATTHAEVIKALPTPEATKALPPGEPTVVDEEAAF